MSTVSEMEDGVDQGFADAGDATDAPADAALQTRQERAETPKPKRRVVKRVIRRVKKEPSPSAEEHQDAPSGDTDATSRLSDKELAALRVVQYGLICPHGFWQLASSSEQTFSCRTREFTHLIQEFYVEIYSQYFFFSL